jgi:DNA-binding response OmpR family regulator
LLPAVPEGKLNASERKRGRGRVLVIEDDRGIAQGVRSLLATHGFDVDVAPGPDDALERAERFAYRVAVADFDLGAADGRDVIRRLLRRHPGIRVLAVTAVDRADALRHAGELGLVECFEKPVDPGELVRAVMRHAGP